MRDTLQLRSAVAPSGVDLVAPVSDMVKLSSGVSAVTALRSTLGGEAVELRSDIVAALDLRRSPCLGSRRRA